MWLSTVTRTHRARTGLLIRRQLASVLSNDGPLGCSRWSPSKASEMSWDSERTSWNGSLGRMVPYVKPFEGPFCQWQEQVPTRLSCHVEAADPFLSAPGWDRFRTVVQTLVNSGAGCRVARPVGLWRASKAER